MAKMKLKTLSGAKKRFKLTKNGKIKRSRAYRRHILTKKTTKLTRGLRMPISIWSRSHRRLFRRCARSWTTVSIVLRCRSAKRKPRKTRKWLK